MKNFSDLGPISLSTFTNKIISRVLHERMVVVLPNIISQNQAGFMKHKRINDNDLLTQDIIKDINMLNRNTNVVVKLDMTKAYIGYVGFFSPKFLGDLVSQKLS